jgi:citrate synthase
MKSSISDISSNSISVAGKPIADVIYSESVGSCLLMMSGMNATAENVAMVNSIIVSFCDHGLASPSTISARLAASCEVDLSKCLIAAIACMGDAHAPVPRAMSFLSAWNSGDALPNIVPGYGHPVHKSDPRVGALFGMAFELFGSDRLPHVAKALEVEKMLKVKLNAAGACAAICLDIGMNVNFAMSLVIIGRIIGLVAHVNEQNKSPNRVICYNENSN